jgi:hypothetical protein
MSALPSRANMPEVDIEPDVRLALTGENICNDPRILDAMWLFNKNFERALSKFEEITSSFGRHSDIIYNMRGQMVGGW